MDSTLYSYYQKCEKAAKTPQILTMADTLFHMAEKLGDSLLLKLPSNRNITIGYGNDMWKTISRDANSI